MRLDLCTLNSNSAKMSHTIQYMSKKYVPFDFSSLLKCCSLRVGITYILLFSVPLHSV